jgi:hypothetical protein
VCLPSLLPPGAARYTLARLAHPPVAAPERAIQPRARVAQACREADGALGALRGDLGLGVGQLKVVAHGGGRAREWRAREQQRGCAGGGARRSARPKARGAAAAAAAANPSRSGAAATAAATAAAAAAALRAAATAAAHDGRTPRGRRARSAARRARRRRGRSARHIGDKPTAACGYCHCGAFEAAGRRTGGSGGVGHEAARTKNTTHLNQPNQLKCRYAGGTRVSLYAFGSNQTSQQQRCPCASPPRASGPAPPHTAPHSSPFHIITFIPHPSLVALLLSAPLSAKKGTHG